MVRLSARSALACIILAAAVGDPPASACTGEPVPIAWLADHAASVMVCDIADIHARWTAGAKRIESDVALTNLDYLKGRPATPRDSMSLVFPGGTIGDTTMRLCCTPELEVGQRWLIFLQPEYRTYPAAGMGQGIFEIRPDADSVPRVYALGGRAVTGIDGHGVPICAGPTTAPRATPRPVGALGPLRVHTLEDAQPVAPADPTAAMTLDAFVARIRPVLDASRAFDLSQPAGRRIETELTPVPLVLAPRAVPPSTEPSPQPRRTNDVPRAQTPTPSTPRSPSEEATR